MKRHPALIPLSHDHHHALVEAKRLHRAADETSGRREAAADFLAFFARDTRRHFREEEEQLFPHLVGAADPATELLTQALLEHQQLHALADALERALDGADSPEAEMRELAETLERHVRFEERTLFPLIEDVVREDDLRRSLQERTSAPEESPGNGPLWGTASDDLNATLLAWEAGAGPPDHVNDERDVLVVVVAGSATVVVDEEERVLAAGDATIVERQTRRRITAGPDGVRYYAAHLRRPPLQIAPVRPS